MHLIYILPIILASATAQTFPPYIPPGEGDVRSPCPGLNSLANHGFLPHNGKGLTAAIIIDGLSQGMNVGPDFAAALAASGDLAVKGNSLATSFNLDDLDEHNFPIEHDASLSRADYALNDGDNYSFNQSIFDTVLKFYGEMNVTSIPVAAKARYARVKTEAARDRTFFYTAQQFVLSYGETALYLSVMGDPVTGIAPLEYVKILFQEDRLPYEEG